MEPLIPSWVDHQAYPFTHRFATLPRGRMHYVEEGQGPPLLFVHGTPTWSFEYRHLIRGLRSSFRCIAPDHLGFFGLLRRSLGEARRSCGQARPHRVGWRPSRRRTGPSLPRDRQRSRRQPAAVPVYPPTGGGRSHPRFPCCTPARRPTLALVGPACRALESGHPGNAPPGLRAGREGRPDKALDAWVLTYRSADDLVVFVERIT
jgi:hypothetical protein